MCVCISYARLCAMCALAVRARAFARIGVVYIDRSPSISIRLCARAYVCPRLTGFNRGATVFTGPCENVPGRLRNGGCGTHATGGVYMRVCMHMYMCMYLLCVCLMCGYVLVE